MSTPTERFTTYQNITIEDVDYSIYDWFDRDVNARVETPTGELDRKVPVLFASGERWASARQERGIRDERGMLILPLISIRRVSITRERGRIALGTETAGLTIARRVDEKTNNVQNQISSRTLGANDRKDKIVYELTRIPFPDQCAMAYDVTVWAQYVGQMNSILEKIFSRFDLQNSFVMPLRNSRSEETPDLRAEFDDRKPLEGYYFVGFVEGMVPDGGNFEEFTDQERIIRYNFEVQVPAYLQLDPEGTRPAIQVETTAFRVDFAGESVHFVDDPAELDRVFCPTYPRRTLPSR